MEPPLFNKKQKFREQILNSDLNSQPGDDSKNRLARRPAETVAWAEGCSFFVAPKKTQRQ